MLTIPLDTLGWIIVKAREFDVKDGDTSDGESRGDDGDVLQDRGRSDPTETELTSWIDDLTDTQAAELTALMWLGRGDAGPEEFADLVAQARGSRRLKTSAYLLGEPMLADYLEEGLEALGFDTSEIESNL